MRELIAKIARRFNPPSETIEGYDQPELIDVILRKTQAYIPPPSEWLDIGDASTVLDFGGGAGIHYKQSRSPSARWAVVESPAMVERAAEFSTDRLKFFTSISEASDWLGPIDLMHSNGALQYLPEPQATLRQLGDLQAKRMLWYRVLLSNEGIKHELQSSLLGDNGPGRLQNLKEKTVRYTRTKIPEQTFLDAHADYLLVERGSDWFRFARNNV
jgi:putative methyltransferase (TIGR04325 family)